MADTTTVGTEGWFGTVTDRIVSVATAGFFLVLEEVEEAATILSLSITGEKHRGGVTGTKHEGGVTGEKHRGGITIQP